MYKILLGVFVCLILALGAADHSKEDMYILEALNAVDNNDYKTALEYYDKLYALTKKSEYLKERIMILSQLGELQEALESIKEYQKIYPNDLDVKKTLAYIYFNKKDIDNTIKVYKEIVALEDNEANDKFLANLYFIKGDYKNARECLLKAFNKEKSEQTLLEIVALDVNKLDFKDSIALIKDYFKDGMSDMFSNFLIEISNNAKTLYSIQELDEYYYNKNKNLQNAKNLATAYMFNNHIEKATELASMYNFGNDFMIDLYIASKDYKKAKIYAKKALDSTKDYHYLGVLAIIEFEESSDKRQIAPSVIAKLKKALQSAPNHLFYNYLGYLLIDYDINVADGIKYVKLALKLSPNNPAYLDSLAWGYYKQGDCQNAKTLMDKIPNKLISDEIKEHLEKINQCLKD